MNALVVYPYFKGIAGYYVFVLKAGGTWPTDALNSYQDQACTVPNSNPVLLDSNGEAIMFVKESYKLIYAKTSPLSPTWTSPDINVPDVSIVLGTVAPGTSDNLYIVSSSPMQTALTDQMMLVMTPDKDSVSTTPSHTFVGSGQNDLTWYGPYTGTTSGAVFTVEVLTAGTPDVVRWKKDGGAWTNANITGGVQVTIEGISFKFARTSGHTPGDLWALTVQLPVKINLDGLGAKIAYENISGVMTAVGAGMKKNFPCQFLYSSSQDAWVWVNPAAPSLTSPAPSRVRREVADDYDVTTDDEGNEVAMTVTGKNFQLPPAANFANQFVYLEAFGPIYTTITADGTEKIYWPGDSTGTDVVYLGNGNPTVVQIQSDSVGWHIMTDATPSGFVKLTGSGTWVSPFTGNLFVTGASGGGGGVSGANGGSAGQVCVRVLIPVTKGSEYDYDVPAASNGNGGDFTFGVHGGSTLILLDGGTGGGNGTQDGEDAPYGFGFGGISVSQTDPIGSAAGGFATVGVSGYGAPGMCILEW